MSAPLAANTVDAAALADELARVRVIPADRLTDLLADFPGGGPVALAEYLVGRGVLTPFQADRALAGEAKSLALGPYRVAGPHGTGSLGPLVRAEKPGRGGGSFAVRLLPLRSLWQAKQAKQFVRTLAAIPAHPVLVPLADADSANGVHYLVWPLTEGRTLAEVVARHGPLAPDRVTWLLARLAEALAACHARQVVHGLLSPGAVVLGADGSPRLPDLGAGMIFAKNLAAAESLFDALSTAVAAAGAFDFAAPEWLADPTNPTPAADQYALGAVGYFALTGRLPAPDGSLPDRLRGRTERPPPVQEANPDVPAELAAVIDLMLNPNPAGRFPGLGDVQALLAELVPDPPPPVEPEPIEPESVVPESAEPDPLFLSQLVPIRPGSSSTWPARDSGATKPPERDNSEASVAFDLPDPVIERPTASSRPAKPAEVPEPVASVETPRGAALKTRRSPTAEPAAEAAPPVKPAAPSPGSKLLGGFDANMALPPLPELPCAALPSIPTPVQWQTAETEPLPPAAPAEEPPAAEAAGWKRVRRKLLFWQAVQDQVQVSVFGPPTVAPGQTVRITVVLHPPGSADSVRTLARAFDRDAEPLGTGYLTRETARGDDLAVHLAVANAGVARSLISFPWQGRPHRLGFELHVPWECLAGPAPALVSVGRDDTRIGRAEFRLDVLPRKS